MSDIPAAAPIPAGWYDDGTGSGRQRWWSGTEWTEHVSAPYVVGAPARPALPADRPVYSAWIWLIVLLPVLSYASILTWRPDFSYLSAGPAASLNPTSLFTPSYFVLLFLGWILYGLTVVFAWRDVVWLRAQGVVRPFPWPWAFLYGITYIIGRSVIVHRVAAPRGRAPIWVYTAVVVVGFIVIAFWTVSFMAGVISEVPQLPSGYSSS